MSRLANYRPQRGKNHPRQTGHGATHEHNPPGSKLIRRFYRAQHGRKQGLWKSVRWYAGRLVDADRKVRKIEAEQRERRNARRR